ncbi:hypothetical protein B0F90DRAFT_1014740 [Multifurca ochricompacta]|uniref:Uncharacterized protein n=1 Tax=Multifurca ochricompacta TaxID=376703 RepID=A0AAD4QLJ6_9AGAM|nr:hypothetical protein B0F90DRAFT_1014740 [Multifurca ochricompacta]
MPPHFTALNFASFRFLSIFLVKMAASFNVIAAELYTQNHSTGLPLLEFFQRYNFLSEVDRGYDTTVTPVSDEADVALSKLKTYQRLEKVKKSELHKFLVRDDDNAATTADGELRYYITPNAVWYTEALFGRSTFGYIAHNAKSTDLAYPSNISGKQTFQREGDVYRELHDARVPNIPRMGFAGDVPLSPEHVKISSFAVQRTGTQDYVKGTEGEHDWCPGQPRVIGSCVE